LAMLVLRYAVVKVRLQSRAYYAGCYGRAA
jgi:hypothetical protein